jgi:hypothetical protein
MNRNKLLKDFIALVDDAQRRRLYGSVEIQFRAGVPALCAPIAILPADILTVNELAERLKVQRTWVYENQRRDNPLPALHCGRYLRFSWPAVCEWLANQPAVKRGRSRKTRRADSVRYR